MKMRSFHVQNYRSLESISLDGLSQLNILIGRNNSGKTAILNSLSLLNHAIHGGGPDASTILTAHDSARSLRIRLVFDFSQAEREGLIDLLIPPGQMEDRRSALRDSSLARQAEFLFGSPAGMPQLLHLHSTKIIAEDNKWAQVQVLIGEDTSSNPVMKRKSLGALARRTSRSTLHSQIVDISEETDVDQRNQSFNFAGESFHPDAAARWPLENLVAYLEKAFFFSPFRHSAPRLTVTATPRLSQDGSNLAQVLHTINSNNRRLFQQVEEFMHLAIPDIGTLQVPLIEAQTEVAFRSESEGYLTRLHDMGGGVEQLLMVATVLLTTGDDSTLFLEEPESHLHPGAQRFMAERLRIGQRQVFLTTHSPLFVNLVHGPSVYLVRYRSARTTVEKANDVEQLASALADIGSRNSDVLLSDAVLFVEGPSDSRVLRIWSEKLGRSLEEHGITLLPMGGGETAERRARISSEVLEGISRKSPVPHLFVLDRDERKEEEVGHLRLVLGDRVHVLERRELENYLFAPKAILAGMRSKYRDNSPILERLLLANEEDIARLIKEQVGDSFGLVLLKRVRSEVAGFRGGLLPREAAVEFVGSAGDAQLYQQLESRIRSRVEEHLNQIRLKDVVADLRSKLEREWQDDNLRAKIAPGAEVLSHVFEHFGGKFEKPEDTVRIANEISSEEVPAEVRNLIERAVGLTISVPGAKGNI